MRGAELCQLREWTRPWQLHGSLYTALSSRTLSTSFVDNIQPLLVVQPRVPEYQPKLDEALALADSLRVGAGWPPHILVQDPSRGQRRRPSAGYFFQKGTVLEVTKALESRQHQVE
eukprot:CAMPEP_0118945240 /NCGR_PEP_ID=MMETSP1169-20130426/41869_1 /TAXON_ID=36882 /ORGANISM="Pyramimonas obovata, Strain CCMP722" /LENGTH=115 /DNA_ID=CAMNT_0006890909 /DNA_START=165 /DNA_END=509 /DNA_ORIENTATION=+